MIDTVQNHTAQSQAIDLTVIIPTFNRSKYVRECIESIQNCKHDSIEIIVADDGSTDDTATMIAGLDHHITYHWQNNTGTPSTARNAGFALSRGKYVAFLDCDDLWLPDTPSTAVALLNRHPYVDILFADARMGNPDQGYISWIDVAGQSPFMALPHHHLEPNFRVLEQRPLFRQMAVRNPVFIGSVIMRREVFMESGGFNSTLRGAADWELWLRLASRYTFGYLSEPLAVYTRHLDNMSSNQEHMIGEFCQTLSNISLLPTLDPSDRDWVSQQRAKQLFYHAYNAFDRGNYDLAKSRFRQAIAAGNNSTSTHILHATCHLPGFAIQTLRRIKQMLSISK